MTIQGPKTMRTWTNSYHFILALTTMTVRIISKLIRNKFISKLYSKNQLYFQKAQLDIKN